MLEGNNPRFPWEPSTTMLTNRLTGTTGASASDRSEQPSLHPNPTTTELDRRTNLRAPRCAFTEGAGLLTSEILAGYEALDEGRKQELLGYIEGFLEEQRSERRAEQQAAEAPLV